MKRFSKVMLIVAAVFALLGLVMCFGGFVLGGSVKAFFIPRLAQLEDLVTVDTADYSLPEEFFQTRDEEERKELLFKKQEQAEILNVSAKEMQSLSLTIGGGQIAYAEGSGDDICIFVNKSYQDLVEIQKEEGELDIEILHSSEVKRSNYPILLVQVPEGHVWEELDIQLMAGQLAATKLLGKEVSVSVKAGDFQVANLTAEETDINTKAGKVEISWLQTAEADLVCKMGAIEIEDGILKRDADISCDAGAVAVRFCGEPSEYSYDLKASVGTIVLNGETYQGIIQKELEGKGSEKIEISCNAGTITVDVVEEDVPKEEIQENVTNSI